VHQLVNKYFDSIKMHGTTVKIKRHICKMWGNILRSCIHVAVADIQVQSKSKVTSRNGPNILCHNNECNSDVCGKSEGKIFQDKIQACKNIT
jgi:hypothetical protein